MSRLKAIGKVLFVTWLLVSVARLSKHVHYLDADRATFNERARAASGFRVTISKNRFGRFTAAGTPVIEGGTADIDFAQRTITLDGATVSTATDRPMTINDIAIEAIARRLEERDHDRAEHAQAWNIKGPNGAPACAKLYKESTESEDLP